MNQIDTDGLFLETLREYNQAPWGHKESVLQMRLPLLGMTKATFHRKRQERCFTERKSRTDKGTTKHPRWGDWTKIIMSVKHHPPKGVRTATTVDAQLYAVKEGLVPPAAMDMPEGTINRIARNLGLIDMPRRENRFEALYPNQVHQFDASGSEHFYPVRKLDNDYLLKLRPRRMKNKEKMERLRVLAYGLTDDFSGYRLTHYEVAAGESALGGIQFLKWAWSRVPEHEPFRGVPEILYMDNGPISKKGAFLDFCDQVAGVQVTTHEPYRSQATGKVEANWRIMWKRFETPFFFDPGWEKREILLSELNLELAAFWRQYNRKSHRNLNMSREDVWMQIKGVVDIAPDAWETIVDRAGRILDAAGCFDYRGQVYQVREIHSCDVWVWRGVLNDRLLVVDRRDGKKYEAEDFKPAAWGTYRGNPKTELERLKEMGLPEGLSPVTWIPDTDTKVVHLVRSKEVRESSFEMPVAPVPLDTAETLEELAAGVTLAERQEVEAADLYNTPLERYIALKVREAKGERLTVDDVAFMREFETDYASMLDLLGVDIDKRVRLAAVE